MQSEVEDNGHQFKFVNHHHRGAPLGTYMIILSYCQIHSVFQIFN